jgi:NTE family protein
MPLIKRIHYIHFVFITSLLLQHVKAQKVGLVLSGGGSSGLCHVGVIKALEENNIPIDYICGTSIGGLIGAYYAIGYTPAEIEKTVKAYFFQTVTRGDLPVKYEYMIKKREDFASWLTLKYNFKTNYIRNLPTNVINSVPIDYYLMETFAGVSGRVHNNFDSLFVPFRCMAADVVAKKNIVFRDGDLPSAIRAGISYPFYLRPMTINNKLLFDGGLYNNFPVDIMEQEFNPAFIIGSNVAEKNPEPDDENLFLQLRSLFMSRSNFDSVSSNAVIIEPWSDESVFNFDNAKQLIDSGYVATIRLMPLIKEKIKLLDDSKEMEIRRERFKEYRKISNTRFDDLEVKGFNHRQTKFISRSIFYKKEPFTLEQLKKRYFRLASEDKIKNIFPLAVLDSSMNAYKLVLNGRKEKPFYLEPGAIISNRPISEAFLGLQYNYLGRIGFSAYINGYSGKLYSGTYSKLRFDIPGRIPFFIEPAITYSRWDYYRSSALFYDLLKPAYLVQEDRFGEIKAGLPIGNISQFSISGGLTEWKNQYYQSEFFNRQDTADITYFDYMFLQACYRINTQNRKMYATEGTLLDIRTRFLSGRESYYPGSTSNNDPEFRNKTQAPWLQIKLTFDSYIKTFKGFKIGVLAEGVYSNQSFFNNYQATILSAPAFFPTPESRTFFIEGYRAHNYLAGGIKAITTPFKVLDIRFEAYVFQPVRSIKDNAGKPEYSSLFLYRYFSGLATAVYNSPIGPLSLGINYYDQYENPFSFFFHIGYIIFNRKSID